jgi:hypothetical protein
MIIEVDGKRKVSRIQPQKKTTKKNKTKMFEERKERTAIIDASSLESPRVHSNVKGKTGNVHSHQGPVNGKGGKNQDRFRSALL